MVVQRSPYVAEHGGAGQRCGDCSTPQIPLRSGQQMVTFTFPETRFEAPRKVGGWLDTGKISEEQQRSANLGIVLRAILAFSEVTLHANQLDSGEGIVYEGDVLITKLATIHVDRLRVR